MRRKRLYVYAGILVVGLIIGIFCLPGGNTTTAPTDLTAGRDPAPTDHHGSLPPIDLGGSPGARAEALFNKAKLAATLKDKVDGLSEAYNIDPTGKWGGEAAAELGHLCKVSGELAKAKVCYVAAQKTPLTAETRVKVDGELAAMNKTEVAPTTGTIQMVTYKVQSGDSLWKIAKTAATTPGAIKKANNLASDRLVVGSTLKLPKGPFDVLITKHTHTLQLVQDGKAIKTYDIGLGDANNTTPTGAFTVTNKLVDPIWYSDGGRIPAGDPRNMLGSRWLGFSGRLGIHGTRKSEESTIGKDMSNGCVRMKDADVQDLYEYLVEGKSKVTIAD